MPTLTKGTSVYEGSPNAHEGPLKGLTYCTSYVPTVPTVLPNVQSTIRALYTTVLLLRETRSHELYMGCTIGCERSALFLCCERVAQSLTQQPGTKCVTTIAVSLYHCIIPKGSQQAVRVAWCGRCYNGKLFSSVFVHFRLYYYSSPKRSHECLHCCCTTVV